MLNLVQFFSASKPEFRDVRLKDQYIPAIDFSAFPTGIDNIHIDTTIASNFRKQAQYTIQQLLKENIFDRRSSKISSKLRGELATFNDNYASLLENTIRTSSQGKRIDKVQLFQVSVIKFLLSTIWEETELLHDELRKGRMPTPDCVLTGHQRITNTLIISERKEWISRNRQFLHTHVYSLVFAQIRQVENSKIVGLRESLLGIRYSIPEPVMINPLLSDIEGTGRNVGVFMSHYPILNQQPDHPFSYKSLTKLVDNILLKIFRNFEIALDHTETSETVGQNIISWKSSVDNIDILFNIDETNKALDWSSKPGETARLNDKLRFQYACRHSLAKLLKKAGILEHIAAAFQTPILYPHFAYALTPYKVYQILVGEMSIQKAEALIEKASHRKEITPVSELVKTKKLIKRLKFQDAVPLAASFIRDFVHYRRDMKYWYFLNDAMNRINVLTEEKDILLSDSNSMLQNFTYYEEGIQSDAIQSHVIIKADIRGSTTTTSELRKHGLNPATHFGEHFFRPIHEFIKIYGAETVFIEGDAIILSLFEYQGQSENGFSTARACGLAKHILAIVADQNKTLQEQGMPQLEIGIGICYEAEEPTFLFDGENRIMISPAIGTADRLSSCSWTLRHKFANIKMVNNVLVFQQPENSFKGEKGVTRLRYNLSGIELDAPAVEKLKSEITLTGLKITMPGDSNQSIFYIGSYPDVEGNFHDVVVRESRVLLWRDDTDQFPITDDVYFEVITNTSLIAKIKQLIRKKVI